MENPHTLLLLGSTSNISQSRYYRRRFPLSHSSHLVLPEAQPKARPQDLEDQHPTPGRRSTRNDRTRVAQMFSLTRHGSSALPKTTGTSCTGMESRFETHSELRWHWRGFRPAKTRIRALRSPGSISLGSPRACTDFDSYLLELYGMDETKAAHRAGERASYTPQRGKKATKEVRHEQF